MPYLGRAVSQNRRFKSWNFSYDLMTRGISVKKAKELHEERIMSISGVTGIAIGQEDKKSCIIVYVKEAKPEVIKAIPKEIEGFHVKIEETGEFVALGK